MPRESLPALSLLMISVGSIKFQTYQPVKKPHIKVKFSLNSFILCTNLEHEHVLVIFTLPLFTLRFSEKQAWFTRLRKPYIYLKYCIFNTRNLAQYICGPMHSIQWSCILALLNYHEMCISNTLKQNSYTSIPWTTGLSF